jgi:hypothetical protein
MNKNKITKHDIVEGITFVLMVVGIITLILSLHKLKEINKDIKELNNEIRITK